MYNNKLHFHFVGIGGSGMSGLAEILLDLDYKVSGSDLKWGATCDRLAELGAEIKEGHRRENLPENASIVVYSSAVTFENPEILEARKRGLPIIRRAEVLAELMRLKFGVGVAGSHGKTTTTSMIASILEEAGKDPTVIIGGQVKSMSSGGKLGNSNFLVAETDESDRSFLLLKPTLAVLTNIDSEHLVAYQSLADLESSFEQFLNSVPFYGLAVLCVDDAKVRDLSHRYAGRKVTYGISADAQIRATAITPAGSHTSYEVWRDNEKVLDVNFPMPGRHMVVNSLAAIAVALEFDIPLAVIKKALENFAGVKRRLEIIGEARGVSVMNDYGHHPAEIKATVNAIREGWPGRRLKVVFQPHRYTRTRDCFAEFLDAFLSSDVLFMTDIYAASEAPISGITGEKLFDAVSHPDKKFIAQVESIPQRISEDLAEGDIVLFLGAGTVGALPEKLLAILNAFESYHAANL